MKRRNQVVVFFAGFVVEQNAFLQRVFHDFVGDDGGPRFGDRLRTFDVVMVACVVERQGGGYFQYVVSASGVATRVGRNLLQHVVSRRDLERSQAAFVVFE